MGNQAKVVIMSRYDPNEIDPVKVALGERMKSDATRSKIVHHSILPGAPASCGNKKIKAAQRDTDTMRVTCLTCLKIALRNANDVVAMKIEALQTATKKRNDLERHMSFIDSQRRPQLTI